MFIGSWPSVFQVIHQFYSESLVLFSVILKVVGFPRFPRILSITLKYYPFLINEHFLVLYHQIRKVTDHLTSKLASNLNELVKLFDFSYDFLCQINSFPIHRLECYYFPLFDYWTILKLMTFLLLDYLKAEKFLKINSISEKISADLFKFSFIHSLAYLFLDLL